jgi:hypothetical protein
VNTLQGTTSFWDEVRTGIEQEARSLGLESVDIEYALIRDWEMATKQHSMRLWPESTA